MVTQDKPKTFAEAMERRLARPRDPERQRQAGLAMVRWAVAEFPEDPDTPRRVVSVGRGSGLSVSEIAEATGLETSLIEDLDAKIEARRKAAG